MYCQREFIRHNSEDLHCRKDCITAERRELYDYLSKEEIPSGELRENVIEEGETKKECTKRKRDGRKKTLQEWNIQGQFVEKTREFAHEFSGKWIRNAFLKKER